MINLTEIVLRLRSKIKLSRDIGKHRSCILGLKRGQGKRYVRF